MPLASDSLASSDSSSLSSILRRPFALRGGGCLLTAALAAGFAAGTDLVDGADLSCSSSSSDSSEADSDSDDRKYFTNSPRC